MNERHMEERMLFSPDDDKLENFNDISNNKSRTLLNQEFTSNNYGNSFSSITNAQIEEKLDPSILWWKNAPFLYHSILVQKLDWPSLTVNFLSSATPNKIKFNQYTSPGWFTQKMLLGTCTSSQETNFVLIGEIKFPISFYLVDDPLKCENYSGFITPKNRNKQGGASLPSLPNFEVKGKLVHLGDVNRAISMPDNDFFIATQGENGKILFFDYSKHPSNPINLDVCSPQCVLEGHTQEGYGLAWNPRDNCKLASCSLDGSIATWDIFSKGMSSSILQSSLKGGVKKQRTEKEINKNPIINYSSSKKDVVSKVEISPWQQNSLLKQNESKQRDNKFQSTFSSPSNDMQMVDEEIEEETSVDESFTFTNKTKVFNKENLSPNIFNFNPSKDQVLKSSMNSIESSSENKSVFLKENTIMTPPTSIWYVSDPTSKSISPQNDLAYHPLNSSLLASCGDNGCTYIWDLRMPPSSPGQPSSTASSYPVNTITFNLHSPNIFASGDDRGFISIWDLRLLSNPLLSLHHHTEAITRLHFNPGSAALLGSASQDGNVLVWDISRNYSDVQRTTPASKLSSQISPSKTHSSLNNYISSLNTNTAHSNLFSSSSTYNYTIGKSNNINSSLHASTSPSKTRNIEILSYNTSTPLKENIVNNSYISPYNNINIPDTYSPQYSTKSQKNTSTQRPETPIDFRNYTYSNTEKIYQKAQSFNIDYNKSSPSTLIFIHKAHKASVGDFCWNINHHEPYMAASVGWDNRLCCWHMSELALLNSG